MNKVKPYLGLIIGLIIFILLSNNIYILFANVFSLFRVDNRYELDKYMYEEKIENIEKQLLEYEQAYNSFTLYDSSTYILAKTSIRDIYDFYNYIIIVPSYKINKNSAVINEKGLVGIVKEINNNTAKVALLTSGEKISVKVGSSYGLLDGYDKKDKLLIVRNINNYENIEKDMVVTTSGLSKIDEGIDIGYVKKTELKGIERIVYVKSYVDFDDLNYLYVLNKWYLYF